MEFPWNKGDPWIRNPSIPALFGHCVVAGIKNHMAAFVGETTSALDRFNVKYRCDFETCRKYEEGGCFVAAGSFGEVFVCYDVNDPTKLYAVKKLKYTVARIA